MGKVDFELLQLNLIFWCFIFVVGIFIFKHHSKKSDRNTIVWRTKM
jgi:hypothetical protein